MVYLGGICMKSFNLKKANAVHTSEMSVEMRATNYAKELGYFTTKMEIPNRRGAADRMFLNRVNGHLIVFFIEFKRPKRGRVSTQQLRFTELMDHINVHVYITDDLNTAKDILDSHIASAERREPYPYA